MAYLSSVDSFTTHVDGVGQFITAEAINAIQIGLRNAESMVVAGAYNVKSPDFGAVGDGVTDDTAAIQAAINAAASVTITAEQQSMTATPAIVNLPPGSYLISSTLTIPLNHASIQLVGAGRFSSVLKAANGLDAPLIFAGLTNGQSGLVDGIRIAHLGLLGNSANNTLNEVGIKFSAVHSSIIEDVEIHDFKGKHLWLSGVTGPLGACLGVTVKDIVIDAYSSSGDGIYLDTTDDCLFVNCIVSNCLRNYYLDGTINGLGVYSNRFLKCWNGFGPNSSVGFYAADVQRIEIDGMIADAGSAMSANTQQIRFDAINQNMDSIRIHHSFFRPSGTNSGIVMTEFNVAAGKTVANVLLDSNARDGTQQSNAYAWVFGGSGTYSQCRITNDQLMGVNAVILPASGVILRQNDGYVTENSGTATIAASGTSIVVNHGLAATPTRVEATATSDAGSAVRVWVDTYTATQFTIHCAPATTNSLTFDWRAWVGEGG